MSLLTLLRPKGAAFAPTDIAGLQLWLDAADTSTITESGGDVSQWDDKSGNDNHATQSTATEQPSTGVDTINGKNVITYGVDVDNYFDLSGLPTSGEATVFLVYQYQTESNSTYALYRDPVVIASGWIAQDGSTSSPDSGMGSVSYRLNGVSLSSPNRNDLFDEAGTSANIGTVTWTFPSSAGTLGYPDNVNVSFTGYMAEVLIYDSALSTLDREAVEEYLSGKWGITLS